MTAQSVLDIYGAHAGLRCRVAHSAEPGKTGITWTWIVFEKEADA